MMGSPGGSWQEFFPPTGSGRSTAWNHLVKAPSASGKPQSLSRASSSNSSLFLDSPRLVNTLSQKCSNPKQMRQDSFNSLEFLEQGSHSYRRAALDFVLELAGPKFESTTGETVHPDTFVSSEEIPVPAFAVDRDMKCTLWNQKMTELSSWSKAEVMSLENFAASLFSVRSKEDRNVEDTLKSAMFGKSLNGLPVKLTSRLGSDLDICLFSSLRTDPVGAVSGIICVAMPAVESSSANSQVRGGEDNSSSITSSNGSSAEVVLSQEEYGDAVVPPSSPCRRPRALVFDPIFASRNSLASQLERCGVESICAASPQEATWRVEQALRNQGEGNPYSVIFGELQAIRNDDYSAVRRIRMLEEQLDVAGGAPKAIVIATVNMNRWNLAGLDTEMHQGMAAGVDAVIPSNIKMQQLRITLRNLGLKSKYLDVPASLPRALSGALHNPLNLSR